jgi:hypothetical protein
MSRHVEVGSRVRWAAIVVAMLAAIVGAVVGSSAPASAEDIEVTGSFSGPGEFELPDGSGNLFHTWHDITGTWTGLGEISAHLDYIVDVHGSPAPSPITSGTFTIATPSGTLTGGLDGILAGESDGQGWPGSFELSVLDGTGSWDGATGSLVLDAHFDGELAPIFHVVGTVSGHVSVGSTGTTSSTSSTSSTSTSTSTTRPPAATTTTIPGDEPPTSPGGPFGPPPATPIEEPPHPTG